ncbi:hypothetical protein ACFC09_03510 [Streptomyces sp. NPDC056161]|uniref:hypothetical protein n=1 Tax=Streptomyces sp. NPDC056161 TaxID=3345732 RepID=UPI0035DD87A2
MRPEPATALQLAAAGRLQRSDKTKPPSAVTLRARGQVLTGGDFYEGEAVRPLPLTAPWASVRREHLTTDIARTWRIQCRGAGGGAVAGCAAGHRHVTAGR